MSLVPSSRSSSSFDPPSLVADHPLPLPLSPQLVLDLDSTSPPRKEEESLECRVRLRGFPLSVGLKRGSSSFETKDSRRVVVEVGRSARFVREQDRSSRAGKTETETQNITLPSLRLRTNSTRLSFSSLLLPSLFLSSLVFYMRESQLVYLVFPLVSSLSHPSSSMS